MRLVIIDFAKMAATGIKFACFSFFSLVLVIDALYEDQAGTFDW